MPTLISDLACTEYLDALTSIYLMMRGSDPAGAGAPSNPTGFGLGLENGTWGAASLVGDVVDAVVDAALVGAAGIDPIVALGFSAQSLKARVNVKTIAANLLADPIGALNSHIAATQTAGATDLLTFLTLRNTGEPTKWQLMVPPAFWQMYFDMFSAYVPKENVWWEVLQGTVYTNALGKLVVVGDVFSAGFAIDSTYYAGGTPKVKITGVTGTGLITVTGTAFNPATKSALTGKTWTYTLAAGDGTYALAPGGATPAPTDSLILAVSAIDVAAGITAGTLYVEAHRPATRAVFNY